MDDRWSLDDLVLSELDFESDEAPDAEPFNVAEAAFWGVILKALQGMVREASAEHPEIAAVMASELDQFVAHARAHGYNERQIGALTVLRFAPPVGFLFRESLAKGDTEMVGKLTEMQAAGMDPFQVIGAQLVDALA